MRVVVTLEDIQSGEAMSACACPIALAIARKVPEDQQVRVYDFEVEIGNMDVGFRRYQLPESAQDFIQSFDDGDGGWTLDFELEVGAEQEANNGARGTKSGAQAATNRICEP